MNSSEAILRTLRSNGIERIFANFGTDHAPLIEVAAEMRSKGEADSIPDFLQCPHESVAMGAAHGHAVVSGEPSAVLVHVDVGTLNLGAALHNAQRANAPIFVMSGLAPLTDSGPPGSRTSYIHYFQDVYDQSAVCREYCKWTYEFRIPANPEAAVQRGIQLATAAPRGPVYFTATREALESDHDSGTRPRGGGKPRIVNTGRPDESTIDSVADDIEAAEAPLVITSSFGTVPANSRIEALIEFAEAAGAGVIEHVPTVLSFPRDHRLHVGFEPQSFFEQTDLLLLLETDVPWVPALGNPDDDTRIIQFDTDPHKPDFPHWDFPVDKSINADPLRTLELLTDRLDPARGAGSRDVWSTVHDRRVRDAKAVVTTHREEGRLTPESLTAAVDDLVDNRTIVLDETVTNRLTVMNHLGLNDAGCYYSKVGAGLGWGASAAVGAKLAAPDNRIVGLLGDGAYIFGHPTAAAWLSKAADAPVLLVVYNNRGWKAVHTSMARTHPEGRSIEDGVPESKFQPELDLSAPASAVDAYTAEIRSFDELEPGLSEAVEVVDAGEQAIVEVKLGRPE